MRPEFFVLLAYWGFALWMRTLAVQGKQGIYKRDNAHVISIFPETGDHEAQYQKLYVAFHTRVMQLSLAMGIYCLIVRGLLPIIFGSLAFFASLNFYKYSTEEKVRTILGGEGIE